MMLSIARNLSIIFENSTSIMQATKKPPDIPFGNFGRSRRRFNLSLTRFNDTRMLMLMQDFSEFFYSNSNQDIPLEHNETATSFRDFETYPNCTLNGTFDLACTPVLVMPTDHNYWALLLLVFPFFTLFGNVLVIMSVVRERSLQTVTNYFIVSLAVADLLVAVLVMPFGVYYLVMGSWGLPPFMCDFYISMDVTSSTSSIFNLVAISVDRYIAVTQPIKYAKHKNSRRVWLTIMLVWLISAAIGLPVVLGLNDTPDRNYSECLFNSQNYVIYSSLGSFYIPCIIMMFLYYSIFKALRERVKKQRAAKRPPVGSSSAGTAATVVIERSITVAETALHDDKPTNTGSGSNEDDSIERSALIEVDGDECQISSEKSTQLMLSTVAEESPNTSRRGKRNASDRNGNKDSGFGFASALKSSKKGKNGKMQGSGKTSVVVRINDEATTQDGQTIKKEDKDATARFTIYKANKASKKKREKSSAKKERKATKTLAIVLGVFLVCWTPFFTCNVLDAICTKYLYKCSPGVTVFIMTTWLGYINSFLNPVIYTIFNPEFRKAFRKILHCAP